MIDTLAIRNNILRLAFSGKLTDGRETDDKVEDLLVRVSPKKRIVQNDDVPHEIPETWAWVKLSDLYKINPKVEADESIDAAFIPMEKISSGFDDHFAYEVQSWGQASKSHAKFRDEDVAFAKISPCFENRKSFIARDLPNGIGGGTTELIILRQKEMLPEYTYYIVTDQRFINTGAASYKGTVGQQRVQSDVIKNYYVPVPPISEQKRIVDIVQASFAILNEIDSSQQQYLTNLDALRSKILDAAILGKLTEQLSTDGNVTELLEKIKEDRKNDIKEGKIKKDTQVSSIHEEELIHDIPSNWIWVRLGSIVTVLGGKRIPAGRKLTTENTGHKYIRVSEMKDRSVKTDSLLYVPEDIYPTISQYVINKEDVYITVAGTIGRVGKIPAEIDGANLTENADRLVFSNLDQDWLIYCLSSSIVQKQIELLTTQVAQPKLAIKRIQEFLIPLPPLKEQKRIAERINNVLASVS
ncbi:MAG: restriction endonuclease subunit S [Mediterraneibacter faecis]|nr:restriction endonuclease subunit S [Mediterraneibacter faecis]